MNKRTRKIPVSPKKLIRLVMSPRFRIDLVLLGFGLWLIVFKPFESSPAFDQMEIIASDTAWGLLFVVLGAVGFVTGMLHYDTRTRGTKSEIAELAGIIGVASGWFLIWLLFTLSNFPSTSSYIYLVPVVESVLVFLDATKIYCWTYRSTGEVPDVRIH